MNGWRLSTCDSECVCVMMVMVVKVRNENETLGKEDEGLVIDWD